MVRTLGFHPGNRSSILLGAAKIIMKKQIVLIHGGDVFETYNKYIKYLKKAEFDPDRDKNREKRWSRNLEKTLGKDFTVLSPVMPCKFNAKYREWSIWFEKLFPYIKDNVVLIGHSLGGTFLVKYLSKNNFPKRILATYLVSPAYNEDSGHSLATFSLPGSLEKFKKQGGKIFIYHSRDDLIAPFVNFIKYTKVLPEAEKRIFKNRGHFLQEEFPELVKDIKSLY